jgi:hypothetical protein
MQFHHRQKHEHRVEVHRLYITTKYKLGGGDVSKHVELNFTM